MAQYDGDIKIGVSLSAKDVKKSADELGKEIEKSVNSAASGDKAQQKLAANAAKQLSQNKKLVAQLEEMEKTKLSKPFEDATKQSQKFEESLEKAMERAGRLRLRMDMSKQGKSITSEIESYISKPGEKKGQLSYRDASQQLELEKKLQVKYLKELEELERERAEKAIALEEKKAELRARNAAPIEFKGLGQQEIKELDEQIEHLSDSYAKSINSVQKYSDRIKELQPGLDELYDKQDKLAEAMGVTAAEVEVERLREKYDAVNMELKEMEENGTKFTNSIDTAKFESVKNAIADSNNAMRMSVSQLNESLSKPTKNDLMAERIARMIELQINAKEANHEIVELNKSLRAQKKEYAEIESRQKQLDEAGVGLGYKEYDDNIFRMAELRDSIKATEAQLKSYRKEQEGFLADEDRANTRIVKLNEKLREQQEELKNLKARQKELDENNIGLGHKEYDENIRKIRKLEEAVTKSKKKLDEFRNAVANGGRIKTLAQTIGTHLTNGAKRAANSLAHMAKNLLKVVANKIRGGIRKLASSIAGLSKHSVKSEFNFKKLGRTLLRYGLGIRSLFFLFRRLRAGVSEGVRNLAQFREGANDTNKALSAMMSSMQYVKNAWGAAFAPIINAVVPWLSMLVDMLARAGNAFGAFISALSGKSTFIRAKKVQQDYAKSLMGTAGAADKAKEALASYDKLEVIQQDNNSGGGAANDINDMFEEVNVDDALPKKILDWIQAIKDAWAEGNFFGVGRMIAEGLNEAITYVDDWINNTLRPKGVEWAANFAEIFNGFILNFDWDGFGKLVADFVNAIADIINTFISNVDWLDLGHGIGEAIKSWFDNIEWDLIGQTFANWWNVTIDTIYGIVTTPGIWESIGTSIATFIENWFGTVHWEMLAGIVSNGINGVLSVIDKVVSEVDWVGMSTRLTNALNQMVTDIDWNRGIEIASNGFNTVVNVLNNVLETFDFGAVGSTLANGVNTAVTGIDWEGAGTLVSNGWNGIINAGYEYVTKLDYKAFTQSIQTFFSTVITKTDWKKLGGMLSQSLLGILKSLAAIDYVKIIDDVSKAIFDFIEGVFTDVNWIELGGTLIELLGKLITGAVGGAFSLVGNFGSMVLGIVEAFFKGIGMDGVAGFIGGFREEWDTAIDEIVGFFSGLVDKIKNFLGINSPSKLFAELGDGSVEGYAKGTKESKSWGDTMETFKSKFKDIGQTISDKWDEIKQGAGKKWEGIKEAVGSKIKPDMVTGGLKNVADAINEKWKEIDASTKQRWDTIKSSIGNKLQNINNSTIMQNFQAIARTVANQWQQMNNATGRDIGTTLKNTVRIGMDGIRSMLINIDWSSVGRNLVSSLSNGLSNAWDGLMDRARSMAESLTNTVRRAFDMNSPSKIWEQIGLFLDEGLWQGLDAGESELMKKVNSLADLMNSGLDLQVPAIAKGAVLPVTESFNKAVHGNPDNANSQNNEGVSHEPIQFILDKKVLAQAVWDEEQKQYKMYNGYVPRMAT